MLQRFYWKEKINGLAVLEKEETYFVQIFKEFHSAQLKKKKQQTSYFADIMNYG